MKSKSQLPNDYQWTEADLAHQRNADEGIQIANEALELLDKYEKHLQETGQEDKLQQRETERTHQTV